MQLIILLFIYLFYLFKGQTAHLLEEQGKLKVKYEKQLYLFLFFLPFFQYLSPLWLMLPLRPSGEELSALNCLIL